MRLRSGSTDTANTATWVLHDRSSTPKHQPTATAAQDQCVFGNATPEMGCGIQISLHRRLRWFQIRRRLSHGAQEATEWSASHAARWRCRPSQAAGRDRPRSSCAGPRTVTAVPGY